MKASHINSALGTSVLALALVSTPAFAQSQDENEATAGEAAVTIGVMGAATVAAVKAGESGLNAKAKKPAAAKAPASLSDLKARGEMAQKARVTQPATAPRPAKVGPGSPLNDLANRGQIAQDARGGKIGSAANLDDLKARGTAAQNARAPRITNGGELMTRRGELAQDARGRGIGHQANPSLEARGNAARNVRLDARNVNNAAKGGPSFERGLMQKTGPDSINGLVRQGDAAQAARGRVVNEGQLVRQIDKTDDIARLNKAGRSAQAARGAGGLKAVSAAGKAADAGKAAKLAKTAKMAKTAKTAATAAKAGKAGRAALAGTGVGAAVVVAEIAATESVQALTGAEIQDPISTGFQYGAAIFDKDVTLADVAAQRREHHRQNFERLHETFTEPGKLKENLSAYGQEKAEDFQEFAGKVDRTDRKIRAGIEESTGVKLDRRTDTMKRYLEAASGDNKLQAVGSVMADRTQHHLDNAGALVKTTGKVADQIGAANRAAIGDATGADLRSVKETTGRYADALKGDNKVQAVGQVMADRTKHHVENTRKVGSKVGCNLGNIFRKKENDKKCK
ncbi:MAG: hypothetical protein R3D89_04850 [Sphingomonadaceae bacterium]